MAGTLLLASTASAEVLDAAGSRLYIQLGGLRATGVAGNPANSGTVTLSGGTGTESIAFALVEDRLFKRIGYNVGTEFFTGTAGVENLFFTAQNAAGTFSQGFGTGATLARFQGKDLCPLGCFGGTTPGGLLGRVLIDIGAVNIPIDLDPIGVNDATANAGGAFFLGGAPWITGTATITNANTNIVTITNGPRMGATGIGFTLGVTVHENTNILPSNINAVSTHVLAGSTNFGTIGGSTSVHQVTLISPGHVVNNAGKGDTIPNAAVMVLRWVPEPGTMLLLGSAVAGLLIVGRKRMKR